MIIDKAMIFGSLTVAAGLLAQLAPNDELTNLIPVVGKLTSEAAVVFLVIWFQVKTLPGHNKAIADLADIYRGEAAAERAEREKDRERFVCRYQGQAPSH